MELSGTYLYGEICRPHCDSMLCKIVARFLNYRDREAVFKAKKMLHGTNMFINNDYSDRVIKKRMELRN